MRLKSVALRQIYSAELTYVEMADFISHWDLIETNPLRGTTAAQKVRLIARRHRK